MANWFEVSKEGLAKLLEKRGKKFIVFELIQNAWDQEVTNVTVTLEPIEGRRAATLRVEDDDPNGFADLSHAFTLFAESFKKGDPTKRGRFNLGEKLVLALCEEASVSTTTGTVVFDKTGRHQKRIKRDKGSVFEGVIKMTHAEYEEVYLAVQTLIPPEHITTTFNGTKLLSRNPLKTFEAQLPTFSVDPEGNLHKTVRSTKISVYDTRVDETPSIYEMGIPVVDTGDKWHVDIAQKVPLNMDRDNVTPAYLRQLRTLILNEMIDHIKGEDAAANWTKDALSDKDIKPEVVVKLLDEMIPGKKAIFDPSDPEANNRFMGEGGGLLKGRMFNKEQWENIRKTEAFKPAGQVCPTSKVKFEEGGKPLNIIKPEDYAPGMALIVKYTTAISHALTDAGVTVEVTNDFDIPHGAFYGDQNFTYNVGRLGYAWFKKEITDEDVNRLILHELGHEYESNHLDSKYPDAVARLGARMMKLALTNPELFRPETYK